MGENEKIFRVAAVQMSPVLFDRDATTEKVIRTIEKCAKEGVRLAVFPETIIPNYPYFAWLNPPAVIADLHRKLYERAVDVPGPVTDVIGEAVKRSAMLVVLGVNERDGGSLYNSQIIFDPDGSIIGKRRKIVPTFHERMIWGRGDGSGLTVFDTALGRLGALICWEHFMPLARYALIAQREEIHCCHFPGAMAGDSMSKQIDAAIRHHAVESGAFVVNATGWLNDKQRSEIAADESLLKYLRGGICTGIVAPYGLYLAGPLAEGEDIAVAEIDLNAIIRQKNVLDTAGHYARPDIFRLMIDRTPHKVLEEMIPDFEQLGKGPAEDEEQELDL
jgi:aliphatic nitrilase